MKNLFSLLLLFAIQFSAYAEWFNVNHPDTANIEVFGNRGDTIFSFQKNYSNYLSTNFGINWINYNSPYIPFVNSSFVTRDGNLVISLYPMGIILKTSTDFGNTFIDKSIISQPEYNSDDFSRINSRYFGISATFDWAYAFYISKNGIDFTSMYSEEHHFGRFIVFYDYNFIYKFNDSLFITNDTNKTFSLLENPGISELGLCEENSKGKLYMLVHDTVFISIDSGWTWQRMNLNLTGLGYLNIDYHDNFYLRTSNKIFCSYDDGVNWTDITENLPLTTCKYQELRFSDTKIFVRADDGNIYYRDIYTGVEDNSDENILTLYPNPVNSYLKIKFDVDEIYPAKIKIYSVFGENVIETDYKDKIDIGCLSPGIYFLRIGNVCKKFIVNR
ncbi:MAG: T9SS type A sorting domain-containing protein [Bacteroidetes bacterium]|nr:MAG: T9SS type A sorting domain-containing protein [Bacteroidota bacterium]